MTKYNPCPKCGNTLIALHTKGYHYYVECCSCGYRTAEHWRDEEGAIAEWNGKRMTNYEKIKNMSIEDMALEICETHMDCDTCRFHNDCESDGEGIMSWLESSNEQA